MVFAAYTESRGCGLVVYDPHERAIYYANNREDIKQLIEENKDVIWVMDDSREIEASLKQYSGAQLAIYDVNEQGTTLMAEYAKIGGSIVQETDQKRMLFQALKATIDVFIENKEQFDTKIDVLDEFKLPAKNYINKTKAQIVSKLLDCKRKFLPDDEFDIKISDKVDLGKYQFIASWFYQPENMNYEKSQTVEIAGVNHKIAWGGIHGARGGYVGNGAFYHIDGSSYYPTLICENGWMTRCSDKLDTYKTMVERRKEFKAQHDKRSRPYKVVINAASGLFKARHSAAYDPHTSNTLCINGQLMLVDLIDKLETLPGFMLIQSNTDGIIIRLDDTDEAFIQMDDVLYEYEKRIGVSMEVEQIARIAQKDVNNYTYRLAGSEKCERKGSDLKTGYDYQIINDAVFEYLIHGTDPAEYIKQCTDFRKLCGVVSNSDKFESMELWNERLEGNVHRVYPSVNGSTLYKVRGSERIKVQNTPEKLNLYDEAIKDGSQIPEDVDYSWIMSQIAKKIAKFNINA